MFEGFPDQFHQFIASRASSSSLPLPLSFSSLHASSTGSNANFSTFDHHPYSTSTTTSHHQLPLHHPSFLHQNSQPTNKNHEEKGQSSLAAVDLDIERDRSVQDQSVDPWSNDEVLALLRIRSSMENWFPQFTWEHVSRKLTELGFKRSAEKCKEKFEEESRYLNHINYSKSSYRFFGELEELYNHGNNNNQNPQEVVAEKTKTTEKANQADDQSSHEHYKTEEDSRTDQTIEEDNNGKEVEKSGRKKRKRQKKFEMFKGFCEDIISKIMAEQEEMHNKLLGDMLKRDQEKVAREEAWKQQEMDRINKELELRAQEQILAGDRQTTIINFLKKFSSSSSSSSSGSSIEFLEHASAHDLLKVPYSSNTSTSPSLVLTQNPNPTSQSNNQIKPESSISTTIDSCHKNSHPSQGKSNIPSKPISLQAPQNPSSSSFALDGTPNPKFLNYQSNPLVPSSLSKDAVHRKPMITSNDKDDIGKRWPKDEVLALINLRCSLCNGSEDKETAAVKAPLWERISKGMLELGYKRSAKRCKEKWENINKYFRKTKDLNKKRSVDSRTCPYFHQLSTLYGQGTLAAPSSGLAPERRRSNSPENRMAGKPTSSVNNGSSNSTMPGTEGEKNLILAPGFEFEF